MSFYVQILAYSSKSKAGVRHSTIEHGSIKNPEHLCLIHSRCKLLTTVKINLSIILYRNMLKRRKTTIYIYSEETKENIYGDSEREKNILVLMS
jgi:hypothetical protein